MTSWPQVTLSEVFDIARGGSPRPIDDFVTDSPDGINWVTISDASEGSKYITRTKRRIRREGVSRSREVKPGDFLLTNSMSFGKPYIMRTSGCIHDGWLVLSPRRDDVDANFFYHLLASKRLYAEFERLAAGATVKNLNIDIVRHVKVVLPPLAEQRRIAAILDKADDLRAKRRAAVARLAELPQAVFFEMFGDPATNLKHWDVVPVSDYVECFQGGRSFESDSEDASSRHRVLKVSALTGSIFHPDESKPVPDEYDPPFDHFVRAGDLLFSRANTRELVGAVAYVEAVPRNLLLPDKLWRFVWRKPVAVEPLFVWALFQTSALRGEMGRRATGTSGSMKNISQAKVMSIRTVCPPLPVQKAFAERLRAVVAMAATQMQSSSAMSSLFSSLQHRAFAGTL